MSLTYPHRKKLQGVRSGDLVQIFLKDPVYRLQIDLFHLSSSIPNSSSSSSNSSGSIGSRTNSLSSQDRQVTYKVTLRRVSPIKVAAEKR